MADLELIQAKYEERYALWLQQASLAAERLGQLHELRAKLARVEGEASALAASRDRLKAEVVADRALVNACTDKPCERTIWSAFEALKRARAAVDEHGDLGA